MIVTFDRLHHGGREDLGGDVTFVFFATFGVTLVA